MLNVRRKIMFGGFVGRSNGSTKNLFTTFLAVAVVSTAFGRPNRSAENPITWGNAAAGLRLGIQLSASDDLRVVLNNIGLSNLSVFAAMKSGNGTSYLFQFKAMAPNGKRYPVVDLRPESLANEGLIIPEVISLPAGAKYEFLFPLKHLVYLAKGRQISMDMLLQQGYTVSVSLEVRQNHLDGASMGGIPPPATGRLWTGRLTSSSSLKSGHHSQISPASHS
jgi:hypothetical protein